METTQKVTPSVGVRVWKPGDRVIMNGNYFVHPGYRDRIWTVASDPFTLGGSVVVKLRDYHGPYASDGLSPAPGTEDGEDGGDSADREDGEGGIAIDSAGLKTSRVFLFCLSGRSFAWTDSIIKAARAVDVYKRMGYEVKSIQEPAHTVYNLHVPNLHSPEKLTGSVPEEETHDAADRA